MDTEIDPRLMEIARQLAEVTSAPTSALGIVQEQLDLAQRQIQALQLEDQGWRIMSGSDSNGLPGPTLEQLHDISELLRSGVAEAPLPKQANNLRTSYTFGRSFIIPGLEGSTEPAVVDGPGKRGPKTSVTKANAVLKDFAQTRSVRDYVLGKSAQELVSTACSTDGVYLLLGDDSTKDVRSFSISEVQSTMVNPDFVGEIWAYLREWSDGKGGTTQTWYYTDRYPGARAKSIPSGEKPVSVDIGKTIIDLSVNNQVGWQFGVPDLWAGQVWGRNYLIGIKDGMQVTSLMAWLSAKVKTQSKTGSQDVGVRVNQGGPAGSVQTPGQGNSIDTYATTGKAYDFDALRPLAALYALAAGVSVVDLLASPSAAGASYGSAQALAPGMRRSIEVRRDRVAAWIERVLEWGTGTYHKVTPASIEETDPYRRMQMVSLAVLSGLFHPDEVRPEMAALAGITLKHQDAPEGYIQPQNSKSITATPAQPVPPVAADTTAPADNTAPTKTAPAPDQGQSNGTGGGGSTAANDQRTDLIK